MSNDHQIWPWYLFSHRMESELDRLSLCHKPMSKSFRELFQDLCMEDLEPEAPSWTTGNMNLGRTDLQSLEIKIPALRCGLWSSIHIHPISWESKHFMALLTSRWYWWAKTIPQYRYTSLYTSMQSNSWRKAYLAIGWKISHLTTFTCWRQTPSRYLVVFFFVLASGSGGFNRAVSDRDRSKLVEDGLF